MDIIIKKITDNNITCVRQLAENANEQGHFFVQKTVDEWIDKSNAFDKKGEALFGAFENDRCVAICGLNIDPYTDNINVGRVRHLYVSSTHRRKGIAKTLVKMILQRAQTHFEKVRLYTNNRVAAAFYESLRFVRTNENKATHVYCIDEQT